MAFLLCPLVGALFLAGMELIFPYQLCPAFPPHQQAGSGQDLGRQHGQGSCPKLTKGILHNIPHHVYSQQ